MASLMTALGLGECAWVSSRKRLVDGGWLSTSRERLPNGATRWGLDFDLRGLEAFESPAGEPGDHTRTRSLRSPSPTQARVNPGFHKDQEILGIPGDQVLGAPQENRHTPPAPPQLQGNWGAARDRDLRTAGGQGVSGPDNKNYFHECVPRLRPVPELDPLQEFKKYNDAVGAERYRVTVINMSEAGKTRAFILDKKNGITQGFTPKEIEQRTLEMKRLQHKGENIYYTPLSKMMHHILIDDLCREKLKRLIDSGYQPAAVLESSPGNYQAIITIRKLATPHDKDVGNRIAEQLNRQYGDPKLSGCIHPHRAPGYQNRKPKHRREDGSFPTVRLIKAERRVCKKTLALSFKIDSEYQEAALKARQPTPERVNFPGADVGKGRGNTITAYHQHYRAVLALNTRPQGANGDASRVDAMIAVRLRVTGHAQESIEHAILQCAPSVRRRKEVQDRDWVDYAKRTARYAFGPRGDLEVADLGKYRQCWAKLEGSACPGHSGDS